MKFLSGKMSRRKVDHAVLNPCLKEQEMTYKCFNDNNFDKELCTKHMENYKYCKSFWGFVQSQRKRQGIYPYLPPVEQREEVKNQFVNLFHQ